MEELPPHKIATAWLAAESCAACEQAWPPQDPPVPTVYTLASINGDLPPQPVCDLCVERMAPALFEDLLADRRRYLASQP